MFGSAREQISCSSRKLCRIYDECKGREKKELPIRFWDVVVLTASDEEQKKAYESQIDQLTRNKKIILGVDYVVLADPVGQKVGCGGATMNVISELKGIYEKSFSSLYILVINAGGYSQRLPSSSALGKIFMALPLGSSVWTLLDLKLASYIPFLQRMLPGIFHAASDTIELIHLDDDTEFSDWNFCQNGLTAIAHPSTTEIGETHGVFVPSEELKASYPNQNKHSAVFLECVEVLQKPSLDEMNRKGAIIEDVSGEGVTLKNVVYTDSCFFIDQEFIEALGAFFEREKPLTCEIDAYGDFMRCLGKSSCFDLRGDSKNVDAAGQTVASMREKLYACLHGFRLNVLVFNCSLFFHLGTTREYIENLTQKGALFDIIGFRRQTFTLLAEPSSRVSNESTIIHSAFESEIEVMSESILEYCHFTCRATIGSRCIVSNCSAEGMPTDFHLVVPSNLFIHTVPISDEAALGYVTIVYGTEDDVKLTFENPADVHYVGKPLKDYDWLKGSQLQGTTLWDVPLFPCRPNPTDSLIASLDLISPRALEQSSKRYSARSVMQLKNVDAMLRGRERLSQLILS